VHVPLTQVSCVCRIRVRPCVRCYRVFALMSRGSNGRV
jgi:hypothetical protein